MAPPRILQTIRQLVDFASIAPHALIFGWQEANQVLECMDAGEAKAVCSIETFSGRCFEFVIGGFLMTCLNEKIVGAAFLMLSGYAYAQSTFMSAPETMTLANIAPMPMEVVPSLPEPQVYLHRYELEYQQNQEKPFYAQLENFYSAPIAHDKYHYEFTKSAHGSGYGEPQAALPSSGYLHIGPSTAPQISILQVPDSTLNIGAQPQRRLSLTMDQWVFSATARVAILHSHSTGATVTVRRSF